MAVWTFNIPQPGDIPAQSQSQILGNFTSIDDGVNGFARNHVSLINATPGARGKHTMCEFIATGVGTALANEATLFGKTITPAGGSAATQIMGIRDGDAFEYQMTNFNVGTTARFGQNVVLPAGGGGWTFLPGGLIFQYGGGVPLSANPTLKAITFATPFLSQVISITLGYQNPDTSSTGQSCNIVPASITLTGFSVVQSSSSGGKLLSWMAIGK